jgi:hypothetical protein
MLKDIALCGASQAIRDLIAGRYTPGTRIDQDNANYLPGGWGSTQYGVQHKVGGRCGLGG